MISISALSPSHPKSGGSSSSSDALIDEIVSEWATSRSMQITPMAKYFGPMILKLFFKDIKGLGKESISMDSKLMFLQSREN
jgi:hypothetical protein